MKSKKKPLRAWNVPMRIEVQCEICVEAHSADEAASLARESVDFDNDSMMAFEIINIEQRGEPEDRGALR